MKSLTFTVAGTDAPLDLILQLLGQHKLNILDIDISSLLEQYLSAIADRQEQDLEIASEFLEMASRLVYIKTVSLLPRHEDEQEKLRRELHAQLMEYSVCKEAARQLAAQYIGQDIFTRDPMPVAIDLTYNLIHPVNVLLAALSDAAGKGARRLPPPAEAFEPIVSRPFVSVTSKIFALLRALRENGSLPLNGIYSRDSDRSDVIATFLALLELIRSKKVFLENNEIKLAEN